jgi:hypothetical protein
MADTATKRPKLNEQQKTEVRSLMNHFRQSHPGAELKELLTHLDVPYKNLLTVGVLRGLAPRKTSGSASARSGKAGARKRTGGQGGKRPANFEKVLRKLADLREERDELERQIGQLETELRQRLQTELGEEQAKRIFAS